MSKSLSSQATAVGICLPWVGSVAKSPIGRLGILGRETPIARDPLPGMVTMRCGHGVWTWLSALSF
jgi:hypothetical protein